MLDAPGWKHGGDAIWLGHWTPPPIGRLALRDPSRPTAAGIRAAAGAGRYWSHCPAQESLQLPRGPSWTTPQPSPLPVTAFQVSPEIPAQVVILFLPSLSSSSTLSAFV